MKKSNLSGNKMTDTEKIYCKGCGNYTGHTEKSILKEDTGEEKNIICKSCGRVICKINGRKPVIIPIINSQITNINNSTNRKKIICITLLFLILGISC